MIDGNTNDNVTAFLLSGIVLHIINSGKIISENTTRV